MRTGLVLGGGGSKGIFEMGAWQAFREIGITFDMIVGTSIGSINAGFMAADDFDGAMQMWQQLQLDQCLAFSENQALKSADLLSLQNANVLARELLTQGGLDTTPLRELLGHYIKEDRVRASRVRYGLMTALLPRLTPMPMWIEEIPENRLIDYMMASAGFPGLQTVRIGSQKFIDGGVVDNLPISMLREAGLRRIVAVDLSASAALRSPLIDNIQITYIHDRMDLGGTFDLSPAVLERNRCLGYLDTMKAFDRLAGEYFSFSHEDHTTLRHLFGADDLRGLEQAAVAYGLDRCTIYRPDDFLHQIQGRRVAVQKEYEAKRQTLQIDHKFRAIMSGRLRVLNLLPPMKLAFLLEMGAWLKQSDSLFNIPMNHFRHLDMAVQAIARLDEVAKSNNFDQML